MIDGNSAKLHPVRPQTAQLDQALYAGTGTRLIRGVNPPRGGGGGPGRGDLKAEAAVGVGIWIAHEGVSAKSRGVAPAARN